MITRLTARWLKGLAITAAFSLIFIFTAGGCNKQEPIIGQENYHSSLSIISYEELGDGFEGVIYRELNSYSKLVASSNIPLLFAFYAPLSDLNTVIMPTLEDLAVELNGQLMIVWVDAEAEAAISGQFEVRELPQFTIVKDAAVKRSLVGLPENGKATLMQLIEPYLN